MSAADGRGKPAMALSVLMESRGERSRCEVETNSVPSELPCVTSLALSLHIWLDY